MAEVNTTSTILADESKKAAKAILRDARISPRKVKIVVDLIRNKPVDEALAILKFTPKEASGLVYKLLGSAIANAENNFSMDHDKLYVSMVKADPGPIMKRMMPRAKGRGMRIYKRTSHITIEVSEKA